MSTRTIIHLLRHGEVFNPEGVLYGRLPGYELSDLGHQMAATVAESLKGNDITHIVASPLVRAQQTAEPTAKLLDLPIATDERVIEAANKFEGLKVGVGAGAFAKPRYWPWLWNPLRPSWGEPYSEIADRMRAAVADLRKTAAGHEGLIVSHQLPVWIARRSFENASFVHDPRNRECNLASLTTLTFDDDELVSLVYSEPAGHLVQDSSGKFVGGA